MQLVAQIFAALDRYDDRGSGRADQIGPSPGSAFRSQMRSGSGNAFLSHLLHAWALKPIAADAEPEFHHS